MTLSLRSLKQKDGFSCGYWTLRQAETLYRLHRGEGWKCLDIASLNDLRLDWSKWLGVRNDPTLQVAMELERIALEDEYFVEKKLYPNIDFYSGITLKAMGFPTEMFTVLFALARTVGWIAQWSEMIEDPSQKIGRPRQLFTGANARDYVPADKR